MSHILIIDDDVHIGNMLEELLARIAVALRKGTRPADNSVLACGPLRLDRTSRQASVNETEIRLTPTEYAVLKLLMSNPAQVMTKSPPLLERLSTDTNVLISISGRDKHARKLTDDLNRHLRLLCEQRRRFQSGDRELKEAVTNISHDLRTPLTTIFGYLDLPEREDLSPETARYLALIANRVEAMKQLTEELFRYSVVVSAGKVVLAAVDMVSVLEESIAGFYGPLKERGIEPSSSCRLRPWSNRWTGRCCPGSLTTF